MGIVIKSERELARMRETGRLVARILDAIEAACVPGVTTGELNAIAARELARAGARSAFIGYRAGGAAPPYPAVLCTSVNQVVVHGIPDPRQALCEGDIVGIDFACFLDGWCADSARTVAVGVVSAPAQALLAATREALDRAIAECVPGRRLGDIGAAVEGCAHEHGFAVVRDMVGHGIGRAMHEQPSVPNYGRRGHGRRLQPGMALAIEPMLNAGSSRVRLRDDGWTIETADGALSAHVEHTIAITDGAPVILTVA